MQKTKNKFLFKYLEKRNRYRYYEEKNYFPTFSAFSRIVSSDPGYNSGFISRYFVTHGRVMYFSSQL